MLPHWRINKCYATILGRVAPALGSDKPSVITFNVAIPISLWSERELPCTTGPQHQPFVLERSSRYRVQRQ